MPVAHYVTEFPRMLFRGDDDTCVVHDATEKAARLAEGWTVRLLPGETEDEYPPVAAPKRRGRPPSVPVTE